MSSSYSQLTLGEYIRRLRRENNRSLGSLAQETGISYTHLSRIESDSTLPNAETVTKVAMALAGDLKQMLELAKCLPREILDRIESHELTLPVSTLPRSAFHSEGPSDEVSLAGPLYQYALGKGLSQDEAAEMETTIRSLCSLTPDKRRHIVQFLRGLFDEGDDATG